MSAIAIVTKPQHINSETRASRAASWDPRFGSLLPGICQDSA